MISLTKTQFKELGACRVTKISRKADAKIQSKPYINYNQLPSLGDSMPSTLGRDTACEIKSKVLIPQARNTV